MIKEDDQGGGMGVGIGGMAIDGMGGMGFTSTGNAEGIALGMSPEDKKKKKRKYQDVVDGNDELKESIVALVVKDLIEAEGKGVFAGKEFRFRTEYPSMAKKTSPDDPASGSDSLLKKEKLRTIQVKGPVVGPMVKKVYGRAEVEQEQPKVADPVGDSVKFHTNNPSKFINNSVDPVTEPVIAEAVPTDKPSIHNPYYTPMFNQARSIGFPAVPPRGPRRRSVLAAILGGL